MLKKSGDLVKSLRLKIKTRLKSGYFEYPYWFIIAALLTHRISDNIVIWFFSVFWT